MTWKPTDEMRELAWKAAHDYCYHGDSPDIEAALIAVQPLIAEEERERMIKLVRHFFNPEHDVGYNMACKDILHSLELAHSLIPSPEGT